MYLNDYLGLGVVLISTVKIFSCPSLPLPFVKLGPVRIFRQIPGVYFAVRIFCVFV